eukprot:Transcript_25419.p1 GENE.Transcript_25419~~Transcript_25419.p1  ORF type:complete len:324 (+),score=50.52 Transcript_25419:59-1030(+)
MALLQGAGGLNGSPQSSNHGLEAREAYKVPLQHPPRGFTDVLLIDETDVYDSVTSRSHPVPTDIMVRVRGSEHEWHLHRAVIYRCDLIWRKLTADSWAREHKATVELDLPTHTEVLLDEVFRFCYNRRLNVDCQSPAVVDLFRLCDFLACEPLKAALEANIPAQMTPSSFVACVEVACARADEPIMEGAGLSWPAPARHLMAKLLDGLPDDLDQWCDDNQTAPPRLEGAGVWTTPLLDAIIRAAHHTTSLTPGDIVAGWLWMRGKKVQNGLSAMPPLPRAEPRATDASHSWHFTKHAAPGQGYVPRLQSGWPMQASHRRPGYP